MGMNRKDAKMIDLILDRFHETGLSIKALSDRSGVAYGAVHPIIAGKRDPQLSTVEKLSRVLGLELRRARRHTPKG